MIFFYYLYAYVITIKGLANFGSNMLFMYYFGRSCGFINFCKYIKKSSTDQNPTSLNILGQFYQVGKRTLSEVKVLTNFSGRLQNISLDIHPFHRF